MSEVTLLCKNEDVQEVVSRLIDLRIVHLRNHCKETVGNTTLDIGTSLPEASAIAESLSMARALRSIAGRKTKLALNDQQQKKPELSVAAILEQVRTIAQEHKKNQQEREELTKELETIEQQQKILRLLPEIAVNALRTKTTTSLLLKKTSKSDPSILEKIDVLATQQQGEYQLVVTRAEKDYTSTLIQSHYVLIDISPLLGLQGTTSELLEHHKNRSKEIENRLAATADYLDRDFLDHASKTLSLALLKAQAPLRFGVTKHLTVIRGYIPTKHVNKLDGLPVLADATPAIDDYAPTLLSNPPVMRNFESLLQLFSLPKYHEIDPTRLVAITFPLFFGFMLGDIGYGFCALLVFLLLRAWYPKIRSFANILILSAISTIFFGFLFGEVFAAEQFLGIHLTPLLHRTEDLGLMFVIAACIGLAHLNLGFLLGIINESRNGLFFSLLKGSWIVLECGLLILGASLGLFEGLPLFELIPQDLMLSVTLIIVAITGIILIDGVRGMLEMPMVLSNTLSYLRLVALGLASVYLGFVVNSMASDLFALGGAWLAFGVAILLVGHTINLLLGLLGPFLHSMRLHYVEFFTKFYEGGGKPFVPFGEVA